MCHGATCHGATCHGATCHGATAYANPKPEQVPDQAEYQVRFSAVVPCRRAVRESNLEKIPVLGEGLRRTEPYEEPRSTGRLLTVSRSALPARAIWAGSGPEGLRGHRRGRLCLLGRPYADTAGPEGRICLPEISSAGVSGQEGRKVHVLADILAVSGSDSACLSYLGGIRPGGAGPSLGGGASGPRGRFWGTGAAVGSRGQLWFDQTGMRRAGRPQNPVRAAICGVRSGTIFGYVVGCRNGDKRTVVYVSWVRCGRRKWGRMRLCGRFVGALAQRGRRPGRPGRPNCAVVGDFWHICALSGNRPFLA